MVFVFVCVCVSLFLVYSSTSLVASLPSILMCFCDIFSARYIVHNSNWGVLTTFCTHNKGYPWGEVVSITDGLVNNSTGTHLMLIYALVLCSDNYEALKCFILKAIWVHAQIGFWKTIQLSRSYAIISECGLFTLFSLSSHC